LVEINRFPRARRVPDAGRSFFPRGDEGETVATRRVGGRTRTRAPDLGTLEESETGSKRSRFFYGVEEGAGIREEGDGGG
jgi:hypothetical protein